MKGRFIRRDIHMGGVYLLIIMVISIWVGGKMETIMEMVLNQYKTRKWN